MAKEPIFVFGSNLAGRHGAGAAQFARANRGAEYGVAVGHTGNAYAIPTKDKHFKPLPLADIAGHVFTFLDYAKAHPEMQFQVTAIGTGLAGYEHSQIAPLFSGAPPNCHLPPEWICFYV